MKEPSQFLPFLPIFPPFPILTSFSDFSPIFGNFFAVRGALCPTLTPDGYDTVRAPFWA